MLKLCHRKKWTGTKTINAITHIMSPNTKTKLYNRKDHSIFISFSYFSCSFAFIYRNSMSNSVLK